MIDKTKDNKELVRRFLEQVRSGKEPDKAAFFMSNKVYAHQMNSEEQTTVKRTPENYAEHIKEFIRIYGNFTFEITQLIAEDDKVYARWIQKGNHLDEIDGYKPTGKPLKEIASCVYRCEDSKIVEYWIQIDRLGMEKQLKHNQIFWAIT